MEQFPFNLGFENLGNIFLLFNILKEWSIIALNQLSLIKEEKIIKLIMVLIE